MEIAGFLKLSELQAAAVCSRHLVVPHLSLDSHQPTPSAQFPSLALSAYIGERSAGASRVSSDGPTPSKQMRTSTSAGDSAAADASASGAGSLSASLGVGGLSAALADLSAALESVRVTRVEARERAADTPALLVPLRRALLEQKLAALAIIRVLINTLLYRCTLL